MLYGLYISVSENCDIFFRWAITISGSNTILYFMREIPYWLDKIPNSAGEIPKSLGEIPNSPGEIPNSLGEIPNSTLWVRY